jgi:hypothetical protein
VKEILIAVVVDAVLVIGFILSAQEMKQTFRGYYNNVDYGFSVEIPAGFIGEGSALHAPNHKFAITLHPKSVVWADASCEMPGSAHTFGRLNARLGTLKAERKPWATTENDHEERHEAVVARGLDRKTPIIYTIEIDAAPDSWSEAIPLFEALTGSFRTFPVRP